MRKSLRRKKGPQHKVINWIRTINEKKLDKKEFKSYKMFGFNFVDAKRLKKLPTMSLTGICIRQCTMYLL